MSSVIVLNQFAMPRTHWGLTRHAELFSRLPGWDTTVFSGDLDHYGQTRISTDDPLFRLTRVPLYHGATYRRVLGWLWFAAKAFLFTVTRRRLDVVYASSPHLLAPLAGLVAARIRRVPFVIEVRDLWPESIVEAGLIKRGGLAHRVLARLERSLYNSAGAIVLVAEGWEDHFRDLDIPVERLTVIPNGVDIETMRVSEDRMLLRREFGFIEGRLTGVYCGAHGSANGLDQLIDVAASLPDIDVVLVGEGPLKLGLQERVDAEGIGNVRFLDPLPKNGLARVLGAADFGIHVLAPWDLLQAGLSPNKVFDYMAAGLPFVSNCQGGLRAIVSDGECGRLGGPSELGEAVSALVASPAQQRLAWGERGRSLVSEKFSRQVAAKRLHRVLESVAPGRDGNEVL